MHPPLPDCPDATATGGATTTDDHPGKRWKLRFWAIFCGQALSLGGSSLTQFVLMWWVADTTGSVAALATAGLAALLPHRNRTCGPGPRP